MNDIESIESRVRDIARDATPGSLLERVAGFVALALGYRDSEGNPLRFWKHALDILTEKP